VKSYFVHSGFQTSLVSTDVTRTSF